jgi:hypothetical protein
MVLSDLNLASAILAASPHSVLAGPYHRAGGIILDAMHALSGPPDLSRAILERYRVDYLVICPPSGERRDGSLAQLLLEEHPPAWLRPLPLPGLDPVRAFAVTR